MGAPQPITSPDFGVRARSYYDLEKTLVAFIEQIFEDSYRLDNPAVNLGQPDETPYDYTERAQSLVAKVPPQVLRGRIPRSVVGEIAADKLPNIPAVIVQATGATVETNETFATVRIIVSAYDENPDSQGYQDVTNMVEAIAIALTSFGQAAIDQAYPIVMPLEWKLDERDTFPHFVAEITTKWELPSGRPMPDLVESITPSEAVELGLRLETEPSNPEVAIP
jgi:hypothetical protein